jgi:hypothetical protein
MPLALVEEIPDLGLLINYSLLDTEHPLYKRAWVLQELILANRMLDCAGGRFSWRCSEFTVQSYTREGWNRLFFIPITRYLGFGLYLQPGSLAFLTLLL